MSKNTKKTEQKVTESTEITKKSINENLDTVALSVAEQDGKAKITQKEKLLSLIGGEARYNTESDAAKRKLLDLCTQAINERISELKAENKAIAKDERKPLKESNLWLGLRLLHGNACAMRSRLRTESEKKAAKAESAEKKAENEAKIIQAAIQAGKVVLPSDDVENVKTCGSAEEIIFSVYAQLTASGITVKEWLRMTKACTLAD